MFQLSDNNYYSPEANRAFMSCSQYEDFLSCEARAMAKIHDRWKDEDTQAFLVGKYFHTHFEGEEAFKEFCQANFDDIFKTRTRTDRKTKEVTIEVVGKYAPFEQADRMIEAAENDPVIKRYIDAPGENEKIMTGQMFGRIPWRIRLDKYITDPCRTIIDWKTVANIREAKYNEKLGQRASFVENYSYVMRAAVYTEIEKQFSDSKGLAPFYLVCLSKEDPPDKEFIEMLHPDRFAGELEIIAEDMVRIQAIKDGLIRPRRCGHCAYCRSTKIIKEPLPYWKLEPGHSDPLEEDDVTYTESQG